MEVEGDCYEVCAERMGWVGFCLFVVFIAFGPGGCVSCISFLGNGFGFAVFLA